MATPTDIYNSLENGYAATNVFPLLPLAFTIPADNTAAAALATPTAGGY